MAYAHARLILGVITSSIILHICGGEYVKTPSTEEVRYNPFYLENAHLRGRPLFFTLPHQDLDGQDFVQSNRLRRSGEAQEEHLENIAQNNENKEVQGGTSLWPEYHSPPTDVTKNTTFVGRIMNDRFIGDTISRQPRPTMRSRITSDPITLDPQAIQLPQYAFQYPSSPLRHTSPTGEFRDARSRLSPKTNSFTRESSHPQYSTLFNLALPPVFSNPQYRRYPVLGSNPKSKLSPSNEPITQTHSIDSFHRRNPRKYSTAASFAHQQQLQSYSALKGGFGQKQPSKSGVSAPSSYQRVQSREGTVLPKEGLQRPSILEVMGAGAASAVTALLVNAGAAFISGRTGLALRKRRSTESSLGETDFKVEEAIKLWAAVEDRDSCRSWSWCRLGRLVGGFEGGPSVALLLAKYIFGSRWKEEGDLIMSGAFASECLSWKCGLDLDQ